jgi:hypothetical protein
MMRGLTQDVEIQGHVADVITPLAPECPSVIGVICAGDLAVFRDTIKQALKRGIAERPQAVWVCIEPKSDRLTHDLMISLGIEPVVLPMLDAWRRKDTSGSEAPPVLTEAKQTGTEADEQKPSHYDFRRVWRDLEMLTLCEDLVIFHKRSGNSPWRDRAASGLYGDTLVVVELGKDKPKSKKERK